MLSSARLSLGLGLLSCLALSCEAYVSPAMVMRAQGAEGLSLLGRQGARGLRTQPQLKVAKLSLSPLMTATEKVAVNPLKPSEPPHPAQEKLREGCDWIIPDDGKDLAERVEAYIEKGELWEADGPIIMKWMENYKEALTKVPTEWQRKFNVEDHFAGLVETVRKERMNPHYFQSDEVTGTYYEPFNSHSKDSKFFDYQGFGVDFTRPLIDWEESTIMGIENLEKIKEQLAAGDNVVFLSNHQSESDTHCIFTLFEDHLGPDYGKIASEIVFMAGERVLRDAIVVPFSRGCNLLTVYSKKHIDSEPELKTAKMGHNQRSMKTLGQLFAKGGTCMWFAPSGGRDRRDAETDKVEPAMFDPNSIEMVRLVAEGAGAGAKTHFYPMALATHNIFPPPQTVGGALGEERCVQFAKLGLAVCDEIVDTPIDPSLEGMEARKAMKQVRVDRCKAAFASMKDNYKLVQGYEQ